jgi:hypothetical protein
MHRLGKQRSGARRQAFVQNIVQIGISRLRAVHGSAKNLATLSDSDSHEAGFLSAPISQQANTYFWLARAV